MQKGIEINIRSISTSVTIADQGNILAWVELRYVDNQGVDVIIIRGMTVKKKYSPSHKKEWLSVDFPGYPRKNGKFFKSLYLPDKDHWQLVTQSVLEEFHEATGGKYVGLNAPKEDVNPDEVPF